MTRTLAIVLLLVAGAVPRGARAASARDLDVALGAAHGDRTAALAVVRHHAVGRRLRLGYGVRLSLFRAGDGAAYTTAPHDLVRAGRVATLAAERARTAALNAFLSARFVLFRNWVAGANVDVGGAGFGPCTDGRVGAVAVHACPSRWNVLRGDTRDHGHLDSEFYVGVPVGRRWRLRAGYSHFFSELTTDVAVDGNDRFRRKGNLVFLALSRVSQPGP